MEKVNLAGGERGTYEVTSRAVICFADKSFFRVEEIDEQGNSQENKKESQIKELFSVSVHFILFFKSPFLEGKFKSSVKGSRFCRTVDIAGIPVCSFIQIFLVRIKQIVGTDENAGFIVFSKVDGPADV